jgi:hypothetical protein
MRQVTDIGMENVENLEAKLMDSFLIYWNVRCHGTSFLHRERRKLQCLMPWDKLLI